MHMSTSLDGLLEQYSLDGFLMQQDSVYRLMKLFMTIFLLPQFAYNMNTADQTHFYAPMQVKMLPGCEMNRLLDGSA